MLIAISDITRMAKRHTHHSQGLNIRMFSAKGLLTIREEHPILKRKYINLKGHLEMTCFNLMMVSIYKDFFQG